MYLHTYRYLCVYIYVLIHSMLPTFLPIYIVRVCPGMEAISSG